MKANEFTHILRQIVVEEIRKELPKAIAQVFQNAMTNKSILAEGGIPPTPPPKPPKPQVLDEEMELKQSLRELFASPSPAAPRQPAAPRRYASDPKINEILNATRPFSGMERSGAVGAAAMAAMQAGVPMGPVSSAEDGFLTKVPEIPGSPMTGAPSALPPVSQAQLLRDDHAPLATIPEGVSALDVARHVPIGGGVNEALTKNYSSFLKAMDRKRGKA